MVDVMSRVGLLLCLVSLPGFAAAAEPPPAAPPLVAPALTADTYAKLKARIATTPDEGAWRDVGWLPTFGEAVVEARRTRKPIFLWAMNGHPLACV
jgi:hypothetical protein